MTCINTIQQAMHIRNLKKYPKRNQKKVMATVRNVAGRSEPVRCPEMIQLLLSCQCLVSVSGGTGLPDSTEIGI